MKACNRGFHLLELLIVLLVLTVLLTLAVPSYGQYRQRAMRAEAVRQLMTIAQCQERIRAQRGRYEENRCLEEPFNTAYVFQVEVPAEQSDQAFTASATPMNNRDECGTLTVDQAGKRKAEGENADSARCWSGR